MPWRLLRTPPLGGVANMAIDVALMRRAGTTGETVLRVYEWSAPVLSLGRNQRARGLYDDDAIARAGVSVVRRPTGGRALLHHREITYSVTAPAPSNERLGESYARVNALLLHALRSLGVPAELADPPGRTLPPGAAPCFAEPARGEITAGGRKLVGSAQWRDDGSLLQHGSILVHDDQPLLARLARDPAPVTPMPATLGALLGVAPGTDRVAGALFDAVGALEDDGARPLVMDDALRRDAAEEEARFANPAWTWRR